MSLRCYVFSYSLPELLKLYQFTTTIHENFQSFKFWPLVHSAFLTMILFYSCIICLSQVGEENVQFHSILICGRVSYLIPSASQYLLKRIQLQLDLKVTTLLDCNCNPYVCLIIQWLCHSGLASSGVWSSRFLTKWKPLWQESGWMQMILQKMLKQI